MSPSEPRGLRRQVRLALDLLPPRGRDRLAWLAQGLRRALAADVPAESRSTARNPDPPAGGAAAAAAQRLSGPRGPRGTSGWIGRGNILMYHRVASDPGDPYELCVTPERFAEQLQVLSSCVELGSLDDVRDPDRRPRRRPVAAVTFDDGYADNLLAALPVAERFGVPVTVFVTSRMVGSTVGFWWDRLARALLRAEETTLSVPVPGGPVTVVTGTGAAARAALGELRLRLLPLPVGQIDAVVDDLCTAVAGRDGIAGPRVLTEKELVVLAEHPLVTIGAHTTDHALLRAQPPASQQEAIAASKAELESVLGVGVRHFAYPFGHRASFDRHAMDAARRAGFVTACTTLRGCVTRRSDPLCLPRRMVRDWGADVFEAELSSWGIC